MAIILSNLNRFTNFFAERFRGKFAENWLLKIPPVVALSCKTLMSENKRLTIKLQGSVVTDLRGCGVVNNQIKKRLLLSLSVNVV